jgi:F-type H+-transporting ATPase subunit epsilon
VSDDLLHVELVAADRVVWSGEAKMLIARTTEGDIGVLPNHAPVLSLMVHGVIDVTTAEDETWVAAVDTGFLSVAKNYVSVLSEHAEMSHDIDLERARADLERAHREGGGLAQDAKALDRAWAEARIRAAEHAS